MTIYFQRPPIGCVPISIGSVKDLRLFARRPKDSAVAGGMDFHLVLADEAKPVPTAQVMKGVVREFKLLGSRANGSDAGESSRQVI